MNKLLQKVAKLFLGISMAAGVGVAIGAGRKDASPVHGVDSYDDLTLVTSSSTLSTDKTYVYGTGKTSGSTFLVVSGAKSSWGDYTTTLSGATEFTLSAASASSFYLKGDGANVSALTSNNFSATTSAPSSSNMSALSAAGSLTHSTTTTRNLRFVSGSGWRWYAGTNSGVAGYLYEVASGPAADVVLDKTNNPFSSTSGSNTSTSTKTLSGIEYQNYGGYLYNSNYLSINRSINGYIGNNTAFSKKIDKIVVNYNSGGSTYFTMYKGASALAETTTVTPKSTGTGAITYNMGDSNQYFKLKLTTTGTYCNINSISIYLGSTPSYTVTKNGTNCTISGASTVDGSQVEDFVITPSTNYDAPGTVTVTAGSTTLVQNTNYSYYVADYVGYLQLYKNGQTANVTITAVGVAQLTVTDSVTHGSLSSTSRIHSGEALDVTIVPASGYTYPTSVTVTMGGSTIAAEYDSSDGTLYYTPVTGNIVVTATCPASGNTYSITTTVTNGTYSGDTSITDNGGVASVTISPTGDYKLPTTVSVSGASHTYNSSSGVISLSSATGNVTITADMVALTEYTITVNETNGSHTGSSTIKESRSASLTFTPASGYGQPASVTVVGATSTWTKTSGILSLSNPTGNVTVTYVGAENELESISISPTSGSYILGQAFVKPTVTAHYTVAADEVIDSSLVSVEGYDPYTASNTPQSVTISYNGKTASYEATVSTKSVSSSYNKISSVSDITEGDYIISYSSYGFDSRDVASGYTTVTISSDSIAQSASTDKLAVHIVPVSGGYTLQVSSTSDNNPGKYINYTTGGGSNTLKFEDTPQTISIDLVSSSTFATHATGGAFAIGGTDNVLAWNNNSGNYRYRFYKVSTTSDDTSQQQPGLNYFAPDLYKKVASGTGDLIRLSATYSGGEKYVGDSISVSDFTVKKQLNTGNNWIDVDSGYTISTNTLSSESNTITVSYTENGVTKTADVVVEATPRSATVTSVTLVQGQGVVKDYIDWSGAAWNYTDLTVHCVWSDSTFNEDLSLATLIQSGDATVSPAKPSVGVTSFTVTYTYHETSMTSNTVSGITVVADYVTSISWTGTHAEHFKAFSGGQLTAAQVGAWSVVPTFAGAGTGSALSFGSYTLKVGSKTISSLPYTWTSDDDGQELSITYGKDVNGDDFVKKNGSAVADICTSINEISHDDSVTEERTVTNMITNAIYTEGKTGTSGTGSDTEFTDANGYIKFNSDKGYQQSATQLRVYAGGTYEISSSYKIKTITFTVSSGYEGGLVNGSAITVNSTSWSSSNTTSKQARITGIAVVFDYEGTDTVVYTNDMNHFDAQKKVVEFAKFMNTTMNGTNVCSGTFANLESAWGDVADKYDELFGASTTLNSTELAWAKKMLEYATAAWGSEAEAACVEKAMKTYEFCVAKYDLDPFMDGVRSVSAPHVSPLINIVGEKANSVAIIVVISMVSVTAIGGYFFLRKRKENI